jgi:hypothetical protein
MTLIPNKQTNILAAEMIRLAEKETPLDSVLELLPKIEYDQQAALLTALLTRIVGTPELKAAAERVRADEAMVGDPICRRILHEVATVSGISRQAILNATLRGKEKSPAWSAKVAAIRLAKDEGVASEILAEFYHRDRTSIENAAKRSHRYPLAKEIMEGVQKLRGSNLAASQGSGGCEAGDRSLAEPPVACAHDVVEFDPGNKVPPYGWEQYPGWYCTDCGQQIDEDERR